MIKRPSHNWLYRHRIAAGVLAVATAASLTFITLSYTTTNKRIQEIEQKSAVDRKSYDTTIGRLKRAAEAKRKLQEAEAAKIAEAAKTATSTPSTVTAASCVNMLSYHNDPNSIDIMVNKTHCLSPLNFAPSDLVSVEGYLLSAKAAPHLIDMMRAAVADGLPLSLTSTYRSYDNQITTYSGWVTANGSTQAADTVSARPGYSEHQTGLAVDLSAGAGCVLECLTSTPQYTWLQQHASEYGFIQRYYAGLESVTGYSPEAWHYRYVGKETALDMKAKGVKSLEQYWNIPGGDYLH